MNLVRLLVVAVLVLELLDDDFAAASPAKRLVPVHFELFAMLAKPYAGEKVLQNAKLDAVVAFVVLIEQKEKVVILDCAERFAIIAKYVELQDGLIALRQLCASRVEAASKGHDTKGVFPGWLQR